MKTSLKPLTAKVATKTFLVTTFISLLFSYQSFGQTGQTPVTVGEGFSDEDYASLSMPTDGSLQSVSGECCRIDVNKPNWNSNESPHRVELGLSSPWSLTLIDRNSFRFMIRGAKNAIV